MDSVPSKLPYLLPLAEALDVALVGGKAINLAKLMQAGLPVPGGFVVTTAAFSEAADGKVSKCLTDEIREALIPFNGKRFAARSSATAEDMAGASMAGQYDTFLNLETEAQIIEAIEKCWQSIRSNRTEAYLAEHGIALDDVEMAVVVQQQVTADAAGVLFTVDPRSGSSEKMLVEASWGLGEAIVSGEVQPDEIYLSATDERVISYDVAEKKLAMYPGGSGFEAVPVEVRKKACLTYEQLMCLQDLGRKAADHFGAPQDIEWAVEGDEVLMLQARPITTLKETEVYNRLLKENKSYLTAQLNAGHGPWVRHNLGETLPHPTPLTWSLISHYMSGSGGFGKMHEELGFEPGPHVRERSFLDRIGGEIYMDCSLMTEMFSEGYPFAYDPELLRSDPDASQSPPTIPNGSFKDLSSATKLAANASAKVEELAKDLDRTFDEAFVPKLKEWQQKQARVSFGALSDEALIELWNTQSTQVLDEFSVTAFLPSMVEAVAVEQLRQFLTEIIWNEEPEEILSTLSVSAKPDKTISGNIDLKKLSEAEWLAEYGHRAPSEFELASPRWNERSDQVGKMAEQLEGTDLEVIHDNRLVEADSCLQKLKESLSADDFNTLNELSTKVRRYLRFREDGKFYLMLAYSELRRTALEFGRRLSVGEDIFFLKPEEMFEALRTGFIPKGTIEERKLEYAIENRVQTPHVIEEEDAANFGVIAARADGPSLEAHSVSCGVACGPATIVLSPDKADDFEEGSILVCPSTDPSWTPLFAKARGLVLERGGSLSHGAVVAREMGLPAVVLDGATELFEQGESITVDANAGWIYRAGAGTDVEDMHIAWSDIPPAKSQKENSVNQLGLIMALVWGVVLGAVFLLPPQMLNDPIFALLDTLIWPLIRSTGMIGTVAVIASIFGLVPILIQCFMTDNKRLFEAKRRSGLLRKEAAKLPADSEKRKKMEALAAPVTTRILNASMVPLALILGPMIMVFMWFPARVDPASWNAEPGRMVSVVAEIDGECLEPVSLSVSDPLVLDSDAVQILPPVRQELVELRSEWTDSSDLSGLPWEVQSAGDHARMTMLSSLNAYLKNGILPQKMTWLIQVPVDAAGAHSMELFIGDQSVGKFDLVFGQDVPPAPASWAEVSDEVVSITINYPRALQQASFFTFPGTKKDLGWLGIYLMAYLPVMFVAKFVLRVP